MRMWWGSRGGGRRPLRGCCANQTRRKSLLPVCCCLCSSSSSVLFAVPQALLTALREADTQAPHKHLEGLLRTIYQRPLSTLARSASRAQETRQSKKTAVEGVLVCPEDRAPNVDSLGRPVPNVLFS
ncbi:hypothetical protein BDZ91DRAFT_718010 [Kalaharituber pfeilii]|nr:hypothetical protein BDZ91DRAFT_718010 [Kalaharituber pfeilii]